jgi:hypothetical protein
MSRLIDDNGIDPVDAYRSLAAYVRDRSVWTPEKRAVWARLTGREGRVAENHPRTGEGPYATFAEAEFKGATLYGASFHNAELGGAHFETPHKSQVTDRTAVNFDLADLKGAIDDQGTTWLAGFYAPPDRARVRPVRP